jgi:hypothetical protein
MCQKSNTRARPPNADATSAKLMGATILEESIKSFGLYLVVRTCGDFRIIRLNDTDTGLIDRNSDLVGYYSDEGLRIDCGPARHQDLSVPLILAALPNRAPPMRRKVSAEGEAALRKAWRVANGMQKCKWWDEAGQP